MIFIEISLDYGGTLELSPATKCRTYLSEQNIEVSGKLTVGEHCRSMVGTPHLLLAKLLSINKLAASTQALHTMQSMTGGVTSRAYPAAGGQSIYYIYR